MAKQLAKEGIGICLFLGKKRWDEEVYHLVRRIALDTVPDRVEDILRAMYLLDKRDELDASVQAISKDTRLPAMTITSVLSDMILLKLATSVQVKGAQKKYRLTDHVNSYIEKGAIYDWIK